jgi:hypothetical protein
LLIVDWWLPGRRIANQSSTIKTIQQSKIIKSTIDESGSPTGGMLAIAAQLDLVARLLAVIAAVLPVRSLRLDGAVAGRVSALGRSSHVDPPLD